MITMLKRFGFMAAVSALFFVLLGTGAFAATSVSIGDASAAPIKTLSLAENTTYDKSNSNGLITSGTVRWDDTTTPHILTLNNATIIGDIKIEGDINILLIGSNSITPPLINNGSTGGALHVNGDTIIDGTGGGSLTATGAYKQCGIYIGTGPFDAKKLTIKNATINATGNETYNTSYNDGIYCNELHLNSAKITAQGGNGVGLGANGGHGIFIRNGIFTTTGNNEITASGGKGVSGDGNTYSGGHGIQIFGSDTSEIIIKNTKLTLTGGDSGDGGSGGDGLFKANKDSSLTLENCEIISATGGNATTSSSVSDRGGYGINIIGGFTLESSTIGAIKGGNSTSNSGVYSAGIGGNGITVNDGGFIINNSNTTGDITGGSSINTVGGNILSGGRGINIILGATTLDNSSIGNINGGAGANNGNAIYITNDFTMKNNSTIASAVGTDISDFGSNVFGIGSPHAIYVGYDFTMQSGASIGSAVGGSCTNPKNSRLIVSAGDGIHVDGTFSLDGAKITTGATGGNASSNTEETVDDAIHAGHGISAAALTLTNGASIASSLGGDSIVDSGANNSAVHNNNAGNGINVTNGIALSGGGAINAVGGAAENYGTANPTTYSANGGHGVQSETAVLNDTSQLTATGGGATSMSGSISGYGINSVAATPATGTPGITINSNNIVLTATSGGSGMWAISQAILAVPPSPQLMFSLGTSSSNANDVAYADLSTNYFHSEYLRVFYGVPTPEPTPTPAPTPTPTPVPEPQSPAIAPLTGVYN